MAWDDVVAVGADYRKPRRTGRWDDVVMSPRTSAPDPAIRERLEMQDRQPSIVVPATRGQPVLAMNAEGGRPSMVQMLPSEPAGYPQSIVVAQPRAAVPRLAQEASVSAPSAPIVAGTVMRRGAPGSGAYGANLDLEPVSVERTRPMSVQEAQAAGLVQVDRPRPFFTQVGRAPTGPNAGQGMTGEAARQQIMDETRGVRWGASGPTSAVRREAAAITSQRLAEEAAARAADLRVSEAQRTPQAVSGPGGVSTYDPKTGQWSTEPVTRGTVKAPQTIGQMDDAELMALNVEYQRPPKATYNQLDNVQKRQYDAAVMAKDAAKADAVLQAAGGEWTPEMQNQQQLVQAELRRRGLIKEQAQGGGGGGLKSWRELKRTGG